MSGMSAANDPIPLPLAARSAGIPARTLRNWIASGKLAAIRGQRGWLVRPGDIAQIAAMIDNHAASARPAVGLADELAADMAASLHTPREDAVNAASEAMVAADQRAEAEALIGRIIAPFVAEQTRLAEELGRVKGERDELRRRAEAAEVERDELRAQAAPQPPSEAEAPRVGEDIPEAPGELWGRLTRWWRG